MLSSSQSMEGYVLRYLLGRWYKVIKALFGLGNSMQILLS